MTYQVERLGHQGDGIADGPVFVPRALPGEVVDGVLEDQTLTKVKILEPSDQRIKAPCKAYNTCGGCAVQHASDSFVSDWKRGIVETALSARDLPAPIRAVHTSPMNSRRRAKLSGKRTKSGALVGFHGRQSVSLIDASVCLILTPAIIAMVKPLEDITVKLGSRKGELSFSLTDAENGVDLAIEGSKPITPMEGQELAAWARAHNVTRLSVNGELVGEESPPIVRFDGIAVSPPPGAFLQATLAGQTTLTKAVMEALGDAENVVDLFAGCGTFSMPAAGQADVLVVEGEQELLKAAEAGWRKGTGLRAMRFAKQDLFRNPLLPEDLAKFEAAIIDPPRAGAEAQVNALAASQINRVASISCNPVTFARDAQILVDAGFCLNWIDVVDQFRWSPHVEIAAEFTRD